MRLRIRLRNDRETLLPINHQDRLAGVVYGLLGASDAEFSRFLHDEGYPLEGDSRRFKLFVFSWLLIPPRQRSIPPGTSMLRLGPGKMEWLIASPVETFLRHLATGLLGAGAIRVGSATFPVETVETVAAPEFGETAKGSCLTPIVAGIPEAGGGTHYLRPGDGEAFSEAVRRNLLNKYRILHGASPADDRLSLVFDGGYLARDRNGGTKKITYKGIEVVGAMAPFTLAGSPELMRLAWECGLGEKNPGGFGMVDVKGSGA